MSESRFDSNKERQLTQLLAALVEGGSDAVDISEIVPSLQKHPRLVHEYVQQMTAHALLSWRHAQVEKDAVPAVNAISSPVAPHSTLKTRVVPIQRVTNLFSHSSIAATLLVATVLYGAFGLAVWQMSRFEPQHPELVASVLSVDAKPVAKLVALHDCRWEGTSPRNNGALPEGKIQLLSGIAELEFGTGAHVTIEGPARFEPQVGACLLDDGKLLARVPPAAVGFSVKTPQVTVVDLGTEFGVKADRDGATEVEVLQGKIELHVDDARGVAATKKEPVVVTAGNARRIEAGTNDQTPTIRAIASNPNRFVRGAKIKPSRQIRVEAAMASSSQGAGRDVRFLHDSAGLTGDCHSNQANFTMWNTEIGKIENEFVLFDLRYPHRLESMKVWNVNETIADYYRRVGAKHVDIYVSLSGKWDPLKRPDEWTKVQDHYLLTCATGKEDYNTPDIVSLANVEARYVGIVFHDHLSELQPTAQELQTVGLSEVQFFGERVELPKVKQSSAKSR